MKWRSKPPTHIPMKPNAKPDRMVEPNAKPKTCPVETRYLSPATCKRKPKTLNVNQLACRRDAALETKNIECQLIGLSAAT